MTEQQQNALFVRLTPEQARRLDRAVAAVPARQKDLIGGLLERLGPPHPPARLPGAPRPARAGAAVPARKKDLIGGLLERFVPPDTPAGLAALRELAGHDETRRRV